MIGESVTLASGGGATIARRAGGAGDPIGSVVVLPALAGVNAYIGRVHDELVGAGYAVATIDHWARQGGPPDLSTPEVAYAAFASVPDRRVADDIRAAMDLLDGGPVGLLGFCLGGTQALLGAVDIEGVAAAVGFYGMARYREITENKPESPVDAAARLTVPFLGHWGDDDPRAPVEDIDALRAVVRGKPAELYVYPGAGHAFHEAFRPGPFRVVAATDAWRRTRTFLAWHLGGALPAIA